MKVANQVTFKRVEKAVRVSKDAGEQEPGGGETAAIATGKTRSDGNNSLRLIIPYGGDLYLGAGIQQR